MQASFKILGITNERSECDRCGRTALQKVYVIETDTGEEFSLGSSCIRKAYQMTQREVTSKAKQDRQRAEEAARVEFKATAAYRAQKAYLHSPQHHIDMKAHGFSYVKMKLKPWQEVRQAIAAKHRVNAATI